MVLGTIFRPGWGGAPSGEPNDEELPTGETIQNLFSLYKKWFSGPLSSLTAGSPIWRDPRQRIATWKAAEGK